MKKFTAIVLVLILTVLLAACGAKDAVQDTVRNVISGDSGSEDGGLSADEGSRADGEGTIDLENVAANLVEEAIEANSFSVAAARQAIEARGINFSAIEPDWDYTVNEEGYHAYGDSGKGVILFTKAAGLLEDGEYEAWLKKAFEATAAASDDGYNIQGFSFGEGDIEKTWDEFINSESIIQCWSYKYGGAIMDVYVEVAEEKPSELDGDPYWNEELEQTVWPEWIYYYNGVQFNVGDGLQKSWDDTWEEVEKAFEENEEEIKKALEGMDY